MTDIHEWATCQVHGHQYYASDRHNVLVCSDCGDEYEDEDS